MSYLLHALKPLSVGAAVGGLYYGVWIGYFRDRAFDDPFAQNPLPDTPAVRAIAAAFKPLYELEQRLERRRSFKAKCRAIAGRWGGDYGGWEDTAVELEIIGDTIHFTKAPARTELGGRTFKLTPDYASHHLLLDGKPYDIHLHREESLWVAEHVGDRAYKPLPILDRRR